MIKKILLLVLALALTASLIVSCGKNEADGFKPENFDFTLRTPTDEMGFEAGYHYFIQDDGSVLISSADLSGDIVIPSELGGKTVTAIGEGAFFDCANVTFHAKEDSYAWNYAQENGHNVRWTGK